MLTAAVQEWQNILIKGVNMWCSDKWKDYELLDASDGERLERWGEYILIRPDPQIIWKGVANHSMWKKADGIYRRSRSGGGEWVKSDMPESWDISYGNLKFRLKPMGFKHTGLFPEQAANWDWFSELILNANRPVKVLNLFAYTGGATIAAAKAGAAVVHVDASKGMVAMAKENATICGLQNAPIRYIVDDCKKFVEREIRRGNKYEGIIMDPPSYGRGPNGEVWKLEDSIGELVGLASALLSDNPLFFLVNSYTTGLSPYTMNYIVDLNVKSRFGGKSESGELCLPVLSTGSPLPCGASTRWEYTGDKIQNVQNHNIVLTSVFDCKETGSSKNNKLNRANTQRNSNVNQNEKVKSNFKKPGKKF